jgi:hypothetical protein
MFALFSSALLTIFVHSDLSLTFTGAYLARILTSLGTLYICWTTKVLLCTSLLCHGTEISAMIAPVSSISGIPVLGRPPSWCTLRFSACFVVSHALRTIAAGWQPSLTHFCQTGVGVTTLRKVKSVKATLSNTRFLQITKWNQYLANPNTYQSILYSENSVKLKGTLRLTVGQSVSLGVEPHDQILLLFGSYGLVFVGRTL